MEFYRRMNAGPMTIYRGPKKAAGKQEELKPASEKEG
jgi:hypothetical protein